MVTARLATASDADQIVGLREIMLADFTACPDNGWKEAAVEVLKRRLEDAEPTMAVTVVDAPHSPGILAACATGVIIERLPGPNNPTGRFGWVFNVSTDPAWRRRGYSRACMTALLSWYEERDITFLELLASESGEGLYADLGFKLSDEPAMRRLPF